MSAERIAKPIKVIVHRPDMVGPPALPAAGATRIRQRAKAADFLANYEDASTRTKPGMQLVGAETFGGRITKCGTCPFFARTGGVLRCNHAERACSVLEPWRAEEVCKAGLWEVQP